MSGISSAVPMLSQITGASHSSLTQQLQQLLNSIDTGNTANNAVQSGNLQNNVLQNTAKNTAADSLTLSPAALSLQNLPLQQLLNAEMSNGGQNGTPVDGESGLTELAKLQSQGDLAAALIGSKIQNFNAGGKHTPQKYAQQYANQSVLHSADIRSTSQVSANVHFVRHIIEGKPDNR